jgi:hypothetical protein
MKRRGRALRRRYGRAERHWAEPDPEWVAFLTKYNDIFMRDYCGYWLFGVARNDKDGWLVFDQGEGERPSEAEQKRVIALWKSGSRTKLPANWYRLNKAAAKRAHEEGVKRWGKDWFENGDANTYDYVVQMALLGEHRYA